MGVSSSGICALAAASPNRAPTPGPEQVDDDEAGGRGEQARQQVVAERLPEQASDGPPAADRGDSRDDRGQDQGDDDHAQQTHEEVPDPADGVGGALAEEQASEGAEEHGAEHLPVELAIPDAVLVDVHRSFGSPRRCQCSPSVLVASVPSRWRGGPRESPLPAPAVVATELSSLRDRDPGHADVVAGARSPTTQTIPLRSPAAGSTGSTPRHAKTLAVDITADYDWAHSDRRNQTCDVLLRWRRCSSSC